MEKPTASKFKIKENGFPIKSGTTTPYFSLEERGVGSFVFMQLIDGRKIKKRILTELKRKIEQERISPELATILVGQNPESELYVNLKKEAAQKVGIKFHLFKFPSAATEKEIINQIKELNGDPSIDGIIVQLPLPPLLNPDKVISAIKPKKDVDGFQWQNRKLLRLGKKPKVDPVLPLAIWRALKETNEDFNKKIFRVVVSSDIFGQTLGEFLKMRLDKVNYQYLVKRVCLDKGLEKFLPEADVIISVCGCPKMIRKSMIKEGSVLIDAGVAKIGDKVIGDVDQNSVNEKAKFLTPTPGGIGPITVATLLENVWKVSHTGNTG